MSKLYLLLLKLTQNSECNDSVCIVFLLEDDQKVLLKRCILLSGKGRRRTPPWLTALHFIIATGT